MLTIVDPILTSKYNKPFPVTLLPSAIGYWLGYKSGQRQEQIVKEISALGKGDLAALDRIAAKPT